MSRPISKGAMLALVAGNAFIAPSLHAEPIKADPKGVMAAQTCAGCHGTQGYIENSAYVPLAGMPREQFIQAMRAFADGSRPSTLMGPLAAAFTEEEIAAMADYFAGLPKKRPAESNAQGGDDS